MTAQQQLSSDENQNDINSDDDWDLFNQEHRCQLLTICNASDKEVMYSKLSEIDKFELDNGNKSDYKELQKIQIKQSRKWVKKVIRIDPLDSDESEDSILSQSDDTKHIPNYNIITEQDQQFIVYDDDDDSGSDSSYVQKYHHDEYDDYDDDENDDEYFGDDEYFNDNVCYYIFILFCFVFNPFIILFCLKISIQTEKWLEIKKR